MKKITIFVICIILATSFMGIFSIECIAQSPPEAPNDFTALPAIINVFDGYSVPMNSISIHSPSLEDVFIYLTGSKLDAGNNEGAKKEAGGRPS